MSKSKYRIPEEVKAAPFLKAICILPAIVAVCEEEKGLCVAALPGSSPTSWAIR